MLLQSLFAISTISCGVKLTEIFQPGYADERKKHIKVGENEG